MVKPLYVLIYYRIFRKLKVRENRKAQEIHKKQKYNNYLQPLHKANPPKLLKQKKSVRIFGYSGILFLMSIENYL
jgi:hypothetical protein